METTYGGEVYRFFNSTFACSKSGKFLRNLEPYIPPVRKNGYLGAGQWYAHRVVAFCWLPKPENAKHVHHKNEDKSDNRVDNLEWLTPKEHFGTRHHRFHTEAAKKKISAALTGYKHSLETRKKISESQIGRRHTDETRAKISAFQKGRPTPPETRKKISESHMGLKHTPESRKKMSASHTGLKRTRATKAKIGKNNPRRRSCRINGVTYTSFADAGAAIGEGGPSVRRRCHLDSFPNYELL